MCPALSCHSTPPALRTATPRDYQSSRVRAESQVKCAFNLSLVFFILSFLHPAQIKAKIYDIYTLRRLKIGKKGILNLCKCV